MGPTSIRTSDTHPIRIDTVQPLGSWGAIGMSFCPGKIQEDARTGAWSRDIKKDVARVREWGASSVVSLIELHEFAQLQVVDLPKEVIDHGMAWIHLPIPDMQAPRSAFWAPWRVLGSTLIRDLCNQRNVFIHCKGGLGRTGTIAACLLIESGMTASQAIDCVRRARRHTVETPAQERFVAEYVPLLRP